MNFFKILGGAIKLDFDYIFSGKKPSPDDFKNLILQISSIMEKMF